MKKIFNHTSVFSGWTSNPTASGLVTFFLLLAVGVYVSMLNYQVAKENQQLEIYNIISSTEDRIKQLLNHSYTTALTMAMTIDNEGVPQNFDSVAAQVMKNTPYIDAVELVPDGSIEYIYPIQGNEPALGYNILEDSMRNKEAYLAVELRQMYFAGPLELKQGEMAVVGRLPIFIQNEFWGFSAVLIKLDQLLETAGISKSGKSGYLFQFSKVDPNTRKEIFFLPMEGIYSLADAKVASFQEGDWKLYVIPQDQYRLFYMVMPMTLLCLVLSVIGGFFIYELVSRPAKLKRQLIDRSRALIQSERKFRAFFEQAAVGVAHVDTKTGRYLEVNQRYCALVGYNEQDLLSKTYMDISDEDDLQESTENVQKMVSGEIREFSMEKRYFQKNGKPVWVNLTVSPMWKPGEEPTTHIAIIEEITGRKHVQQLILESSIQAQEEEKNRIASELHDGIVQELVASGIQCENLANMVSGKGEVKDRIDQLTKLIKKITSDTRSLSHNLLSAEMNEMSFNDLIERLDYQLKSQTNMDLQIKSFLDTEALMPREVKVNLYRAIQELTTNIIKHSRATFGSVTIEQIGKEIYVTVRDNGVGLIGDTKWKLGIGMYNVKNRIYKIGGNIEYRYPDTGGLEVSFSIPLF